MGYDARTVAFAALSYPMRLALIDLVDRNGIYRNYAGYDGSISHKPATIEALKRRGLCNVRTSIGEMGAADPTKAGRQIIIDEFNDKPALVDCDQYGRRKRS